MIREYPSLDPHPTDYLHPGDLAYVDCYLGGLIPCRVLTVSADSEYPTTAVRCTVKLTASRQWSLWRTYNRGEVIEASGLGVVHRAHVHRRKYGTRLGSLYGFRVAAD